MAGKGVGTRDGDGSAPARPDAVPTRLDTSCLFRPGETEIRIDHEGMEYRLRITRSNKLILFR